jgi:hypothetical protein
MTQIRKESMQYFSRSSPKLLLTSEYGFNRLLSLIEVFLSDIIQYRNRKAGTGEMENISEKIKNLPPELQREVENFVNSLMERKSGKTGRKLRQDWAGALKDFRGQYTSCELQKKALEWRGD